MSNANGASASAANGTYIDQGEFELIHERVHVTVTPSDEARRVAAFAELHVVPLSIEAASLVVNARQINVTQVSCARPTPCKKLLLRRFFFFFFFFFFSKGESEICQQRR
jgi:hypothetical protein